MSIKLKKGQYTTVGPDDIWQLYKDLQGIFRGTANASSAKLIRPNGPRRQDLDVRVDPETNIEMVYPNSMKGISFADSVETLARKDLEGHVWMIPHGKPIPEKLVFNIKDYDHPLLNVSEPMSVLDFTVLLDMLMDVMVPCDIKIKRGGKIVELKPNALKKVATK